jgi:hypothetical protein
VIVFYAGSWISAHLSPPVEQLVQEEPPKPRSLARVDLPGLLKRIKPHLFPVLDSYILEDQGTILTVETSIDPDLQAYVQRLLKRSKAHQAGVVALRPDSGQILRKKEATLTICV